MNFYSLDQVVSLLAARITVPAAVPAELAEAYRCSQAAGELHQALLNSPKPPKWTAVHPITELPVLNAAAADEILSALVHMAGWYDRAQKAKKDYDLLCWAIRHQSVSGGGKRQSRKEPEKPGRMFNLNEGKYTRARITFGCQDIGFLSQTLSAESGTILRVLTASIGMVDATLATPEPTTPTSRGTSTNQKTPKSAPTLNEARLAAMIAAYKKLSGEGKVPAYGNVGGLAKSHRGTVAKYWPAVLKAVQ